MITNFYTYNFTETFKPLKLLRNIDLFFNPKLFQPGSDACIPPIAASFSLFKTTSTIKSLGNLFYFFVLRKSQLNIPSRHCKEQLSCCPHNHTDHDSNKSEEAESGKQLLQLPWLDRTEPGKFNISSFAQSFGVKSWQLLHQDNPPSNILQYTKPTYFVFAVKPSAGFHSSNITKKSQCPQTWNPKRCGDWYWKWIFQLSTRHFPEPSHAQFESSGD